MPRTYIKKRSPPSYTPEDLSRAVEDILNHNKTYAEVEQYYSIPKSVVFNRIKGRRTSVNKMGAGRSQTLNTDVERDIENCVRARARMGCPCNKEDVKAVVTEYVSQNNLKTPFVDGRPGDDWYYSFMRRHPGLSFKKPEPLQKCRKDARDPFVIYEFYKELKQLFRDNNLENNPAFVFNCDESGFPHDPSKQKAIGERGRPLSRVSGGSGRDSTTVLASVSADGSYMPPLIVFKGVGVQARWTSEKAYPGTRYTCSSNGWMEEPQFFEWFASVFVPHINSLRHSNNQSSQAAALLFDGHSSHISLRIVKTAIENNIHLVKFPSHLTDKLQPLDKCVFGPVKKKWEQKLVDFAKVQVENRESARLSKSIFVELLGQVWIEGMKPENIKKGFLSTGTFPVNSEKFPEAEFSPTSLKAYKESNHQSNNLQDVNPSTSQPFERQAENESSVVRHAEVFGTSSEAVLVHKTPPKETVLSKDTLTPNTIVGIFAQHNKRATDVSKTEQVRKQIIPRLKPVKYGEILTTEDVLKKMEEAESFKNSKNRNVEKKCGRKDSSREKMEVVKSKKRKTINMISTEEDAENEIDESTICQDSSDDENLDSIIRDNMPEVTYHKPEWGELKIGIFILVDFVGGHRNKVHYKYVCCVQDINQDDGDIIVQGYQRDNDTSSQFVAKANDVSTITFDMIEALLPDPTVEYKDRKIIFGFPGTVAVFEK